MKRNKKGQYLYKPFKRSNWNGLRLLLLIMSLGAIITWLYTPTQEPISPLVHAQEMPSPVPTMTPTPVKTYEPDDMSIYISEAVQEFLPTHKSESLMIMHCLAHRENGHAANRNCGDSGASCGPFQYKQETWNRMRRQMIKAGFATETGDRYDKKESARTTAWAINNGNAKEWGPIMRDAQGSDFASCPVPSWYIKK